MALYFSKGILAVVSGWRVIWGLSVAGEQKTSWPSGAGGLGEHRVGAHLGQKEQALVGAHCLSMFTQPSGYCQVVSRMVPVPWDLVVGLP